MDYDEAYKGACERERCEIVKIAEANIGTYGSEQEEGEIREVDEPPRLESPIQKGATASVEQEQVHIRQSASPGRPSHKGESAANVVLQQKSMNGAIHEDMSTSIGCSFVQDVIEKEQVNIRPSVSPERGSHEGRIPCIVSVEQYNYSAIQEDMAATPCTSSQGVFEDEPSPSAERGSHIGETASIAVVQKSKYTASEGRHVDVRQSTSHRIGNPRRSYSPSEYSCSKERHKKRKEGCFRYSDSRWVLKKIEEVCSQRLRTLLSRQNGDRKNLKTVWEKHEVEFFQKYAHSYKAHLAHVVPTVSYCRMILPKQHFSILRERFHKHMKSQLIKFVKQQISDRNKEKRIKSRWIFEAKAGYLKKLFYATSLTSSKFNLEKLECHMNYLDGEKHLKYFDMQSLANQIEVIASNKESESEGLFASGVTETILESSPSLLETNGPAKLGFSVGVAEEMATLESRSSQSTCAPTMEFGEKNGTQTTFSAAAQNQGGNLERPYACQLGTSAALEPAKAVTTEKSNNVSEPIPKHSPLLLVTNGATQPWFSDVSEQMSTLESSSSQLTCKPGMDFGEKDGTQIAFSAAAQNEGENMGSPCNSQFVTSSTSELSIAENNDKENAAPISREKRRRISSGNDISEGPCCTSGRKFGEKHGTRIALSPAAQNEGRDVERSCASHSDKDAALELAMTVNTDSEYTPVGSNEKQTLVSSGNNISEDPCSRSQIKFPYKPNSNLCRTTLHQEEPPAARPPPPLVNNSQMIQAEDTGGEVIPSCQISSFPQVTDQPNMRSNSRSMFHQHDCGSTSQAGQVIPSGQISSFPQVTDQTNMHSNSQSTINQHDCGSTSHAASHPYQPPGGNTHSARIEVGRLGASHVRAPDTQLPTGSTPGQFLAEDGLESNPFTTELSRIKKLQELIAKRHQEKREQLILARQIEMAQVKKKFDGLVYNSEVEVLQRRRELKITCDKIYKQQILAEVLQVIFNASAKVIPDSPRGAAQKTTAEPNWSSDQRNFQFTAPVSAPASASIYQSPHLSVQASTDASLRQHRVTAQHTYMDSSGRSTANLMNYPSGGMGLAYRRQA